MPGILSAYLLKCAVLDLIEALNNSTPETPFTNIGNVWLKFLCQSAKIFNTSLNAPIYTTEASPVVKPATEIGV